MYWKPLGAAAEMLTSAYGRACVKTLSVRVELRFCLSDCNGFVKRHTFRDKKLSQMCPQLLSGVQN